MHFGDFINCLTLCSLVAFSFAAGFKITDIKCEEFDPKFATFEQCDLKLIERDVKAVNVYVKLHKLPVTNVSVDLQLWKKSVVYIPFLFKSNHDYCKFMANTQTIPGAKIFSDILLEDSNLNHTCPFNHDIIVKNFVVKPAMARLIPLPSGEYMISTKVSAYNDLKAEVKAYFEISDKKI